MVGEIHISLAAEPLGIFFGLPITNTLLMGWVVVLLLAAVAFFVSRTASLVPGKFQLLVEEILGYVLGYIEDTLEDKKKARFFFPLIATLFLFIFVSNLIEFTPGIGSVGFFHQGGEFTPLLRSLNTDFNTTLALAIIVFLVIEIAGVSTLGFLNYIKKFVNVKSALGFVVGLLELVSEFARLISFSFRLFGNIFAGEVLIVVAAAFLPFILPAPLMLYEVFVGFIQAAIFSLLTLFFIKIAITVEEH